MTVSQSRKTLAEAEHAYATAATGRDLTEAREWLTVARASHYRDCVEVVERLDYLLGPFHLEAENWTSRTKDDHALILEDGDPLEFNMGDLRAIAKLYEEVK